MNLFRYYKDLESYIQPGKVLVIFGPRRVGKTTLINNLLSETKYHYKLDNGENIETQHILSSQNFEKIFKYVGKFEMIICCRRNNSVRRGHMT